jgi:cation transport ATPase
MFSAKFDLVMAQTLPHALGLAMPISQMVGSKRAEAKSKTV